MDPRTRLDKGRAAAQAGDYEKALREYIWFHNHALEHDRSYYGVRLSFALGDWMDLGKAYPPALDALKAIRDEKVRALRKGSGDHALFHDVASINEQLFEEPATHALFKEIAREAPDFAGKCASLAMEAIVGAGDFVLAARYSPAPEIALLDFSDDFNKDVARHRAAPPIKVPRLQAYTHIYCNRVRLVVRILEGLRKREDAEYARQWAVALVEDRHVRAKVRTALYLPQEDGLARMFKRPTRKSV